MILRQVNILGRRRLPRRTALTLVETLLALSIGSMIVVTASSVAIQTVQTHRTSERVLADRWERCRMLDQFENDVRSLITWKEGVEPIQLGAGQNELITLKCLVDVADKESAYRSRVPGTVTYRLKTGRDGIQHLVREVSLGQAREFSEGNIRRRVLSESVRNVELAMFVNKQWRPMMAGANLVDVAGVRLRGIWGRDESSFARIVEVTQNETSARRGRNE